MSTPTLQERAKRLREALDPEGHKRTGLPKPIILEFTGSPDAGKTTTIDIFDPFFRRLGFEVKRPQEGAEVIRHVPRTTHVYNIRTGLYQLSHVIDAKYDRFTDVFILDRGLYDPFCWMEYWLRKGKLDEETARHYQRFFTDPVWLADIDVCYFVVCDAEEAIRRNLEAIPSDEFGETTNPESIRMLADIARKAYAYWHARGAPVFLVDTTKKAPKDVASELLDETLHILERRFGIGA